MKTSVSLRIYFVAILMSAAALPLASNAALYRINYIMDLHNDDLVIFGVGTGSTDPWIDAMQWATVEVWPYYWDEPTAGPGGLSFWGWVPLDPWGSGEFWQEAPFDCQDNYEYHLYTSHRAANVSGGGYTYLYPDVHRIDDTIDGCNEE